MNERLSEWPTFFTATNLEWKPLLAKENCKQIIVESLRFLIDNKRIRLYSYVIMNNHIHLIWQPIEPYTHAKNQLSFMKFTAQQIKFYLLENNKSLLDECRVGAKDREFQIWERNPLAVELITPNVTYQKLNYIHENPVKAGLASNTTDYHYSSAKFYISNVDWHRLNLHRL